MLVVATGSPIPNTVTGTGTTAQTFQSVLNMPGSGRLDGAPFTVRANGSISAGVSSTAVLTVYANYPAGQYPVASVTNAVANTTGGANIALYNANNNFVLGQYITVAGTGAAALNGTVGPLIVANSTAFAGQVAGANVANTAAVSPTAATATVAPQPLYTGVASAALNVGGVVPFMTEIRCIGTSSSNVLTAFGTDQVVNINVTNNGPNFYQAITSTGLINPVPGVNFKNEPPVFFTVAETFGSSNAANTATLKSFYLED